MNREIKFRGKRIDNGEWVTGHYSSMSGLVKDFLWNRGSASKEDEYRDIQFDDHLITEKFFLPVRYGWDYRPLFHKVDPKTVGQYTGLKDKNGNKIYEGDVLRWKSSNPFSLGEIKTVKVWYSRARFWCNGSIGIYLDELLVNEKCEVIGNIFDNPELLGKEA